MKKKNEEDDEEKEGVFDKEACGGLARLSLVCFRLKTAIVVPLHVA